MGVDYVREMNLMSLYRRRRGRSVGARDNLRNRHRGGRFRAPREPGHCWRTREDRIRRADEGDFFIFTVLGTSS